MASLIPRRSIRSHWKPVRLIAVGVRFAETTAQNAQMDLL
jgi:hypothetical protein